jgi:nucleoside-diphosphate-sugar epimerase
MRVLVTGSAGHLGEALVRMLRNTGQEVIGFDRAAARRDTGLFKMKQKEYFFLFFRL